MICVVRSYDLKRAAQAEETSAEAPPHREKHSPMVAFWHSEISPLNPIIHVWGCEDLEERNRIRAEAAWDLKWPREITPGNIFNLNSEIWNPAPFMRPLGGDQVLGGIDEIQSTPTRTAPFRYCCAAGRRPWPTGRSSIRWWPAYTPSSAA